MRDPLLSVTHLKKYFPIRKGILQRTVGHVRAVDDVNFEVFEGETLGVVGESGCGKSTMGRTILRLMDPTSGDVVFNQQNLSGLSAAGMRQVRRQMQIVFQDPYASLNPSYKVGTMLQRPMAIHNLYTQRERRRRVAELLDRCGLDASAMNRYPSEFSGGQRQRIGIARALTLNPKFVILDEPVSALDVSVQAQIISLLQELQSEFKLTYLFIAHDLSIVRYVSDRVAVMYLGQIMELSDSSELFHTPLHPYTKALLSSIPIPAPHNKRERIVLKGEPPNPARPPVGCPFYSRCSEAMDVCATKKASWKEVRTGHFVACHLYQTD